MPVILIAIGGAIDYSNAVSNKAKFQNIADAAALAGAKGQTEDDMEEIAESYLKYYEEKNSDRFIITDSEIFTELENGRRTVRVDLYGKPRTFMLHMIGLDNIPLKVSSTVNEEDRPVEISLVLDISWSMRGQKMDNLKVAADNFIDVMLKADVSQSTSMSIVPFGGNVNIGSTLAERFMPTPGMANYDPSDFDYRRIARDPNDLAGSAYRFTDGMNCIETTLDDHDTDLIPSNSRSQLPRFMNRQSFITICPEDENAVLFNSNSKTELKQKMSDITMSHGTGMDVGALWGLKALSPSHRGVIGGAFSSRPGDFNGRNKKILIIMSDGNITGQGRPRRPNDPQRLTHANRMNNAPLYHAGTPSSTSAHDDAIGRFEKVCEAAEANGITVYTIGYQIDKGGTADTLLSECASKAGNYFLVENMDIDAAFKSIAGNISELRIVD